MNFPARALPWLAVSLAAVAGVCLKRGLAETLPEAPRPTQLHSVPALESGAASPVGVVTDWENRLAKSGAADLAALYAEIQSLETKDPYQHHIARRLLCARMAEVDPAGAIAFFSECKTSHAHADYDCAWRVRTEWALHDPDAAYAAIITLSEPEKTQRLEAIGNDLLRENTEAFLAWHRKTRLPLPSKNWALAADAHWEELAAIASDLGCLYRSQPEAEGSHTFTALRDLYEVLADSLAKRDAEKALTWAGTLPEKFRPAVLAVVLQKLANQSPNAIPGLLEGEGADTTDKDGIFSAAVRTMAEADPLHALAWVEKHNGATTRGAAAIAECLTQAMRTGRLAAAQVLDALWRLPTDSATGPEMINGIWRDVPADQLAAAADWLTWAGTRGSGASEWRGVALQSVLAEWIIADRDAAAEFLRKADDTDLAAATWRNQLLRESSIIDIPHRERVISALRRIPAPFRAEALCGVSEDRGHSEAPSIDFMFDAASTARALDGLPPSEALNKAVKMAAEYWARTDPESALAWAWAREEDGQKQRATGAAVEAWAGEDSWGASRWIDALPDGERRDVASLHLARSLSGGGEPESAWTWAAQIGNPALRQEAREEALRKWRDISADDARAAVDSLVSSLPAPELTRLLAALLEPSPSAE